MSVFIKKMDLPKCCDDCPFLDDNGDYPSCIANNYLHSGYNFPTREKRMSHCPLTDGKEYEDALIAQMVRLGFWE